MIKREVKIHLFWSQWNPDFSNLQEKRKLVREIGEIEGGIKLRLISRVLFGYE